MEQIKDCTSTQNNCSSQGQLPAPPTKKNTLTVTQQQARKDFKAFCLDHHSLSWLLPWSSIPARDEKPYHLLIWCVNANSTIVENIVLL